MPEQYRAAVIGSTGRGGYGHGLDTCFLNIPGVQLVAVADDDPNGLRRAGRKLGADRLFPDYREMLKREPLDLVSIGPRWVTDRAAMVTAAARAGCHIYCEKPFAADLADADTMVRACDGAGVKIAVAHQFRGMPPVRQAVRDVHQGKYGKLLRLYARPKDDHRGGGEELSVHGTHLFDLMIAFAGRPRWVSGHVVVGVRDATKEDKHEGNEPVGPIAGDSIAATFGFDQGVRGFFDSTANLHREGRSIYGLLIECEEAVLHIRRLRDIYVYPAPVVLPEEPELAWRKVWIQDWHFTPQHQPRDLSDWLHVGNKVLVRELIAAVESGEEPTASGEDALYVTEMIQGVYASHFVEGRRIAIPQQERVHPLNQS